MTTSDSTLVLLLAIFAIVQLAGWSSLLGPKNEIGRSVCVVRFIGESFQLGAFDDGHCRGTFPLALNK